jgi:hypothetical protein
LSDLFKEHKKGKAAAEAFAKKRGLKIEDEESVTVLNGANLRMNCMGKSDEKIG